MAEGTGVRVESQEQFRAWLDEKKPPKEICVALAARAALRVLPVVGHAQLGAEQFGYVVAQIFRANALAWALANPSRIRFLYGSDLLAAIGAAGTAEARCAPDNVIAADVARAAYTALQANDNGAITAGAAVEAVGAGGWAANAADPDAYWEALSSDLRAIEGVVASQDITAQPLWPEGLPLAVSAYWRNLPARLLRGDGWDVWIRWYDARLKGERWSEERDLAYATVPIEKWDEAPAAANAWIAERLEALEPPTEKEPADPASVPIAVPSPKPATVEPVIRDGKIVLPPDAAQPELDVDAFEEALKAFRSLIADLADDLEDEANIDKRAIRLLRRIAERIPEAAPTQAQLFELAHQQETLEDYGRKVVDEWPDLLASRYLGVVRAFDGTMRQFAKWRTFKQNALKDRLSDEQRAKAPELGKRFAEALRAVSNAEYVDETIAAVIEAIADDIERVTNDTLPRETTTIGTDTRPEDLVTSIENTVKRISDAAVQANLAKKAESSFGAKVLKGFTAQFDGEKVGESLNKWAFSFLLGYAAGHPTEVGALLTELMQQFPNIAQWLRPLLEHLKR